MSCVGATVGLPPPHPFSSTASSPLKALPPSLVTNTPHTYSSMHTHSYAAGSSAAGTANKQSARLFVAQQQHLVSAAALTHPATSTHRSSSSRRLSALATSQQEVDCLPAPPPPLKPVPIIHTTAYLQQTHQLVVRASFLSWGLPCCLSRCLFVSYGRQPLSHTAWTDAPAAHKLLLHPTTPTRVARVRLTSPAAVCPPRVLCCSQVPPLQSSSDLDQQQMQQQQADLDSNAIVWALKK